MSHIKSLINNLINQQQDAASLDLHNHVKEALRQALVKEARASVPDAVEYLKSLGLEVDPTPVSDEDGKITFKVIGKNGHEVIQLLDKQSNEDVEDEGKQLWIGQGWDSPTVKGMMDMEYFDRTNDWDKSERRLIVKNISKTECTVTLSDASI